MGSGFSGSDSLLHAGLNRLIVIIPAHSCDQVARFFTGLDLLPPGLVPINQWALTGHIDATTGALVGYSAIARKP